MEMLSTVLYSLPLVENEIQVLIYRAEVYHGLHNLLYEGGAAPNFRKG